MNNQKIKETLDMGSFLKELAEEGNVKFGFAKKLGINQIKLLEIEGGRNTVSMDIENGTFTPEKLLAMEEAIKSYLRQKDKENRHQEGYQSKLKIYKEKVDRMIIGKRETENGHCSERNFHTTRFPGNPLKFMRNSSN